LVLGNLHHNIDGEKVFYFEIEILKKVSIVHRLKILSKNYISIEFMI